jgi:hypothetical protein
VALDVSRSRSRLFWQLQISSWLALIPFFTGMAITIFDDVRLALFVGVVRQVVGFCLTLVLWRIYRRWPADKFQIGQHAWRVGLWCLAATAADLFLSNAVMQLTEITPFTALEYYGSLFIRFALYLAWSAFYFVIRQELSTRETQLRLARAEAENREAELQLLRAQMNPHFIFNALNTIICEAEDNPPAVVDTTHAVADYLRFSLSQNSHQARLGHELTAMSNYLRVERASHGAHRFEWAIDATEQARLALAPTALVQPLIENAIKYGFRTSPLPLRVRISARVDGPTLEVSVENTGEWRERAPGTDDPQSHGIGLSNLQRRLSLLYGDTAHFSVLHPPGLVRIVVRLPFVVAPVDESTLRSANPFGPPPPAPR